jgi:uncharacterized protein YbaP (TraB family)
MKRRCALIKTCTLALVVTVLATGATAKSCLWKVTSETGILYLQGSVHILKADHYPLAPAIEQAYAKSAALVLEVDMAEMALPETQRRIMEKAMLPGDSTLQEELDAETYQKLGAACTEAGLPVSAMAKFKPWFACINLMMLKIQKMGFDPNLGLDKHFYDKAKADGKRVIGLESIPFQIDLFDHLAATNPNAFVGRALADLEMLETEVGALGKAWAAGDIATVEKLMAKSFEGYPELYKTFVLDRNARWVKTLDDLLKKPETHLVVVGAGHLPGKGGLLELLKQKGYAVEPL